MSQYYVPDSEDYLECPYDKTHMVRAKRFQYHLMKCRHVSSLVTDPDLQIYGGPGSLSHDFKIWPITFQGSGPSGPILFSCEQISLSYSESRNSTKQKVLVSCRLSIQ